jgi:hypothetical protein
MAACCSHDHDCEAASCGESSLHGFINHVGVTCLNASDADAAARVLRPWHERRVRDVALESLDEDEPELLLHIPFTTDVKARHTGQGSARCASPPLTSALSASCTSSPPAARHRGQWRRRWVVTGRNARVHQPR